jgi:hypothetical protein
VDAPGVAYHPLETLEDRARSLAELSEILDEVGSDHALIGGLAVGYHARKRATIDVDMLVPRDRLDPLARALTARGYVVRTSVDMVRAYPRDADPDEDDAIVALVAREANPVLAAAAAVAEPAIVLGHPVRIVPRGALVALKFHAAISARRDKGDRLQDVADLSRVIKKGFGANDEAQALQIAALSYPGAEAELARLLDDLRNGRLIKI